MGKSGLKEVAEQNAQKAAYAKKKIGEIEGFSIPFSAPTFNEFVVRGPKNAANILEAVRAKGTVGGLALSHYYTGHDNDILICVTETNSREQIDELVSLFR